MKITENQRQRILKAWMKFCLSRNKWAEQAHEDRVKDNWTMAEDVLHKAEGKVKEKVQSILGLPPTSVNWVEYYPITNQRRVLEVRGKTRGWWIRGKFLFRLDAEDPLHINTINPNSRKKKSETR